MSNEALNLRLKQYLEAEKAILVAGQSYKIGNRTLTRANLSEIREAISSLIANIPGTGAASYQTGIRARCY